MNHYPVKEMFVGALIIWFALVGWMFWPSVSHLSENVFISSPLNMEEP